MDWLYEEPTHYHCPKCHETFEACDAASERWGEPSEFGGVRKVTWTTVPLCPFCGSDDLSDAHEDGYNPEVDDLEVNSDSAPF